DSNSGPNRRLSAHKRTGRDHQSFPRRSRNDFAALKRGHRKVQSICVQTDLGSLPAACGKRSKQRIRWKFRAKARSRLAGRRRSPVSLKRPAFVQRRWTKSRDDKLATIWPDFVVHLWVV